MPPAKACSADTAASLDHSTSANSKEETNVGPEEAARTADSESTAQVPGNQRTTDRDEHNEAKEEGLGSDKIVQPDISPRGLQIRAALQRNKTTGLEPPTPTRKRRNPWIVAIQPHLRKDSKAQESRPELAAPSLPLGSRIQYSVWGIRKTARGYLPHVSFPTGRNLQSKASVEVRCMWR